MYVREGVGVNHGPKSTYWKKRADAEITRIYKGRQCLICGSTPCVPHHIVGRANGLLRHDTCNIIPLCNEHHCTSNTLSAHSTNAEAQRMFGLYIMQNHSEIYDWVMDHRHDKGVIDYQARYEELKGVK